MLYCVIFPDFTCLLNIRRVQILNFSSANLKIFFFPQKSVDWTDHCLVLEWKNNNAALTRIYLGL